MRLQARWCWLLLLPLCMLLLPCMLCMLPLLLPLQLLLLLALALLLALLLLSACRHACSNTIWLLQPDTAHGAARG